MDGADDCAAGVNGVADGAHDYCGRTCVQPCQEHTPVHDTIADWA